jgi:hypothetical protein
MRDMRTRAIAVTQSKASEDAFAALGYSFLCAAAIAAMLAMCALVAL